MIAQYSIGPSAVLLTGSTGHLGCHLLANIAKNLAVYRIYAFNRPNNSSVQERHRERFQAAGLHLDHLKSSKLRFVEGDLSARNLGLSDELYNEVCGSQLQLCIFSFILRFNNR